MKRIEVSAERACLEPNCPTTIISLQGLRAEIIKPVCCVCEDD